MSTRGGFEPRAVWGTWPQRGLPRRLGRGREAGPSWRGGCSPSTSSCCWRACCLPGGERCEEQGTAPRCHPPRFNPWLQVVLAGIPTPPGTTKSLLSPGFGGKAGPGASPRAPPITAMPRGVLTLGQLALQRLQLQILGGPGQLADLPVLLVHEVDGDGLAGDQQGHQDGQRGQGGSAPEGRPAGHRGGAPVMIAVRISKSLPNAQWRSPVVPTVPKPSPNPAPRSSLAPRQMQPPWARPGAARAIRLRSGGRRAPGTETAVGTRGGSHGAGVSGVQPYVGP